MALPQSKLTLNLFYFFHSPKGLKSWNPTEIVEASTLTMSLETDMMLDLFRSEVETHSEAMTQALLALEQDPEATRLIDGMMRAAHSIKGAARIVGVQQAVEVAHVMEDCFVAAQRSQIVLKPSGIDVLLKGVDMLGQISANSRDADPDWNSLQSPINALVSAIKSILAGHEPSPQLASQPLPRAPEPCAAVVKEEAAASSNVVGQDSKSATVASVPDRESQERRIDLQVVSKTEPLSRSNESPVKIPCDDLSRRLSFPSDLTAGTAEAVRQRLVELLADVRVGHVQLDLGQTTSMDAIGVAFLDGIAAHARQSAQPKITLVAESPQVQSIIDCLAARSLRLQP
jgi:chemotaxis protein histidine kinase CheA